ncbi:PREDICTED: protein NRT1/ PTR FAMILY 1.3 [Tarenaya hassleriana]|uniref:protein NRT1/ PTR FAMILY 1.3 n=1 Tax=Tarenaya hassleriana TaxID=28532 RepID=UPI00053C4041|nr:PREDICTED: protein NRT1/ PTR FAMILY 1.3 [Tarenaya hassleriana]
MEEALLAGKAPLRRLRPPKGGFRTIPFILGNQALEKVAYYGVIPNMIVYMTREYGMGAAEAANALFLWSAATNFFPLLGAFLSDCYSGRFLVVGLGSSISLLGMLLLWSTTLFPQARPQCDKSTTPTCQSTTPDQLFLLYSSFALTAVGAGGIRSSCLAFAADQLKPAAEDDRDKISAGGSIARSALESLFNWYYISIMVASFISQTCLVYIQTSFGWKVGFGVPVAMMALSVVLFFAASPFYVKAKGDSGLVAGLAQVVVSAFRNRRRIDLASENRISYHHQKGSSLLIPSDKLRFLNKACVLSNPQQDLTLTGIPRNPWNLCTVQQVEDLKSLVRVLPVWSTGIALCMTTSQGSFVVLQAKSMDRQTAIPGFQIPAGSYGVFMIISFVIFLAIYDRVIVPIGSRIRRKPFRLGLMQRMGTGLVISVMSMAALATVEYFRRKTKHCPDKTDDCKEMSATWLLPYMVLSGVAEALNAIAQNEFFYGELPKTMSSIATTLFGLSMAAASLISGWFVSAVDSLTGDGRGGSWVSGDINSGHLDYYYWVISGLCVINVLYFVHCSRAYGKCKGEDEEEEERINM